MHGMAITVSLSEKKIGTLPPLSPHGEGTVTAPLHRAKLRRAMATLDGLTRFALKSQTRLSALMTHSSGQTVWRKVFSRHVTGWIYVVGMA